MAENTLILSDAAHGFVPFNGMNAGFEDALVFHNLLEKAENNLCAATQNYQDSHWSDTEPIADFSLPDYMEMVRTPTGVTFCLVKNKTSYTACTHVLRKTFVYFESVYYHSLCSYIIIQCIYMQK